MGVTWFLYVLNCLLLTSTIAAGIASTVDDVHRHSSPLHRLQTDAKGARLIRSETFASDLLATSGIKTIVTVDASSRVGKEIHSHYAMLSSAVSNATSAVSNTTMLRVNATNATSPDGNLTAADNDWSAVRKAQHLTQHNATTDNTLNATGNNLTAADNNWTEVRAGDATPPVQHATEENATDVSIDSNASKDANATHNITKAANETKKPSVNITQPEVSANKTHGPEVNASHPSVKANATSDEKPSPTAPPPPVTAAPVTQAPPITIINKIVNKVNVTVNVNVTTGNGKGGMTVNSDANVAPVVTGNQSQGGNKRTDAKNNAETDKMPMDIWKGIVKSGPNTAATGTRNALFSDSSL